MIVKDKSLIQQSKKGKYPNVKCLYSTIPREMRLHMYRVSQYANVLFEQALKEGLRDLSLPKDITEYSEEIFLYHDIGRCYIPAELYNKVEELTEEEKTEIKKHTLYALHAEKSVYFTFLPEHIVPYFRQVAVFHHEWYNGNGYPYGRKGKQIPFMARVCAVADAFDGMVSWKSYRNSMTCDEAFETLQGLAGTQFQPELVECFIKCRSEIVEIHRKVEMV